MKRFQTLAILPALFLLSCNKSNDTAASKPAALETAAQAARVSNSPFPSSAASSPNPLSLTPPSPGCGRQAPSALAPKPEEPPDSCGPK